ncbi:hypothetical protein IFM89_025992 [Coptis chinensis]|uniref:Uncharacterized protein n=1 Tax=Coptis chinensis TaxID=261450 RepID=A0A835MAS6_9MAGN|nr:hypothetical protein IFM89_025992 [Coptis chinensis]
MMSVLSKCQVMGHYAHIGGGFLNVGFTEKDLYNKMGKERRSHRLMAAALTPLANLEDKVKLDPLFHYNYELNASGQLICQLFWWIPPPALDSSELW